MKHVTARGEIGIGGGAAIAGIGPVLIEALQPKAISNLRWRRETQPRILHGEARMPKRNLNRCPARSARRDRPPKTAAERWAAQPYSRADVPSPQSPRHLASETRSLHEWSASLPTAPPPPPHHSASHPQDHTAPSHRSATHSESFPTHRSQRIHSNATYAAIHPKPEEPKPVRL